MKKYFSLKSYFYYIYKVVYILISPFISIFEEKKFEKYGKGYIDHQPIFILGAPRTGSTFLYQVMTNISDVIYINNITCLLNKNILFGLWISKILFKNKPHNCFKSNFGNTKGLNSPSECGDYWYRWLPKHKHFIDHQETKKICIKKIGTEVVKAQHYFDKPLLFKNLNAGQRLRLLIKIFPNAKFIFVRRNPLDTAQSILRAKRRLKIPDNQFWSIMPSNVKKLKKLPGPEQIVKQIYFLEKQIATDLKLFPRKNIHEINFDNFSSKKILNLISQIGLNKKNNSQIPKVLRIKETLLNSNDINSLKNEIKKLDWSLTHVK